ncbi:hypothetical protein [Cohnella herbarum]|uniref:Alpha glucuronidase N-terminal domain-containing protein n=1 Tax=Cohnella herbarum TaxID=2728023 RepID=A0A7Z2VPK6_9BACL|nr:hypothetical protein [Cohnella herbarum]QJD86848.1 hypothetical protein HH215_29200 [Cohnella herbarum]
MTNQRKNDMELCDISDASIVLSASVSDRGRHAVSILIEEIERRSGVRLPVSDCASVDRQSLILIKMIPSQSSHGDNALPYGQEGYRIQISQTDGRRVIEIESADDRGMLYGVGKLLRIMYLTNDKIEIPTDADLTETPHFSLRGHQLGYRPKTNAYDAWTPEIYSQYIRELALFGANSIEIVPPITDDEITGPLMKYDPLLMMRHVSEVCDAMDLDVWIWYPNMGSPDNWYPATGNDEEFMKPAYLKRQLEEREEIFSSLKRIDHIMVPGGDPGALSAQDLFDFMPMVAKILNKYHPNAKLWISPQAFNPTNEWLDTFYENVRKEPSWLAGVVFAPWEKHTLPELRKLIPSSMKIRNYPDITHTINAQYPVHNWDTAFALTHSRECINPRPVAQKHIHNFSKDEGIVGSLTYSEGINDDVNKFVWSGQDWNPETPVLETLREYARFLIHPDLEYDIAHGLLALERNFEGPMIANRQITQTLRHWREMEQRADDKVLHNYRFESGLLRAYYDAYVQRRLIHEEELEQRAMEVLSQANDLGTIPAMERAEEIFNRKYTQPVCIDYRSKCLDLADRLFEHIGAQLTVSKHQGVSITRGAFVEAIDTPLNDSAYLLSAFRVIRSMDEEPSRMKALHAIIHRTDPGAGGFYDSFAADQSLSRVEISHEWKDDPGYLHTALIRHNPGLLETAYSILNGSNSHTLLCRETLDRILPGLTSPPLAWISNLSSYYSAPVKLTYSNLDSQSSYTLQVMGLWGGGVNMTLNGASTADSGKTYRGLMETFEVTPDMIPSGVLEIVWINEESGIGPYINELWLRKNGSGGQPA